MPDLLDPYAEDASAEEQQKALAMALRRQQSLGTLAQLSGDPVLSGVGKSLLSGVDSGEQRLESSKQRRLQLRLESKKDAEQRDYQGKELDLRGRELGIAQQRANADNYIPVPTEQGIVPFSKKTGEYGDSIGSAIRKSGGKSSGPTYFGEDFEPIHPEAPPALKDKEASELRGSYAAGQELQSKLKEYAQLAKENQGLDRLVGPKAQRLITLHGEIKPLWLEAKGLKRFTENENHLLDGMIPQITGADGLFHLPASAIEGANQIRQDSIESIRTKLHARGLRIKGEGGTPGQSKAAAPKGKVQVSNGKETLWIDPADVADAAKDNYHPVGG